MPKTISIGDEDVSILETEDSRANRTFWLRWVIVTTAGFVIGGVVLLTIVRPPLMGLVEVADDTFEIQYLSAGRLTVGGLVFGLILGAFQWLVLRQNLHRAGIWILATTLGSAIGFVINDAKCLLLDPIQTDFSSLNSCLDPKWFSALIVGVTIGLAQWLYLRRFVSRASWWILASAVTGLMTTTILFLSFGAMWASATALSLGASVFAFLAGAMCTAVPAAVLGGVLVWLLRQPLRH